MPSLRQFLLLLPALLQPVAAEGALPPAVPMPAPLTAEQLAALPGGAETAGDTLLLRLCRAAAVSDTAPVAQLAPAITQELRNGADALAENAEGCNALFYINGLPELKKELEKQKLLPRELALRIPHDDTQLLRYMKLRIAQNALCPTEGCRRYLVRRYCAPAFGRAQDKLESYLNAGSLHRLPSDGIATTLEFMLLADPQQAHAYINKLHFWQHGEHFLEEIPAAFLQSLLKLRWQVNPGHLRAALQKLNSMLPATKDDMIDCYASVPMAKLLELLVTYEGNRALPDLQKYAKSYDPELVQASLRLQLRLRNIIPPDETDTPPADAEQAAMREALLTDAALHNGTIEGLTPAMLQHAATYLQQAGLPQHAEIIFSLLEEGEIIVTESSMPAVRAQYEDLQEQRPRVVLLKRLLETAPTPQAPQPKP